MIIGARTAELTDINVDAESCTFVAAGDVAGEAFDFDVQTLTRMSAVKAKLTRFFDLVADPKFVLSSRWDQ